MADSGGAMVILSCCGSDLERVYLRAQSESEGEGSTELERTQLVPWPIRCGRAALPCECLSYR